VKPVDLKMERDMGERFDIIGDVHGRIATLRALADRLGYRKDSGRRTRWSASS